MPPSRLHPMTTAPVSDTSHASQPHDDAVWGACRWAGMQGVHRLWRAWYKHARTRRPRHDEAPPQPEKRRCARSYEIIVSVW